MSEHNAEISDEVYLPRETNALAIWAKKNEDDYDVLAKKKATALKLAIQCINDGTLSSVDGIGSPLSRKIKDHHGCEIFEMNSNWVETSQLWKCPCCDRGKFEISRMGNKGQILAKLVVHHDHIEEALKAAFNKVFVESGTDGPTNTGLALVERMAPAFSSYAHILICEDCNNADTAAKKHLTNSGFDVRFQSFSIRQIRQFIHVVNNVSHSISKLSVLSLWAVVEPEYKARMKLIYQVAKAAVTQDYWYEKYPLGVVAIPTLSNGYGRYSGLELISAEALSHEMAKNNIVHTANWSRWRTESKKLGLVPPDNYLAMILSLPGCAKMWGELEDAWKCPICQRSKFEIVRFESNKVSFGTHKPTWSSPLWRGVKIICAGCCSVVNGMKSELRKGFEVDLGATFNCITPDELRSIITARPHSFPLVDKRMAKELVDRWVSK